MPICIAGMHRSGTSMIARLLNRCGVWLGPERDLLPAAPDNPEGFWEHPRFLAVNELLLVTLGGTWAHPPQFVPGWAASAHFVPILTAARALAGTFPSAATWGWKDPVNSLTLPFWRLAVPDLSVVVCVRHPLDVAASLSERHGCSEREGLELWRRYAERLLFDRGSERLVVTHYDAYFEDGAAELRRVASALGLTVESEQLDAALASLRRHLRHHRTEGARALPPEVAIPYTVLCNEAGWDPKLRPPARRRGDPPEYAARVTSLVATSPARR